MGVISDDLSLCRIMVRYAPVRGKILCGRDAENVKRGWSHLNGWICIWKGVDR